MAICSKRLGKLETAWLKADHETRVAFLTRFGLRFCRVPIRWDQLPGAVEKTADVEFDQRTYAVGDDSSAGD